MMNSKLKKIANGAFPLFRFGPRYYAFKSAFWNKLRFLHKTEFLDKGSLEEYQLYMLKKLLEDAYENCSYYRKMFKNLRIKPSAIDDFSRLHEIPPLDKHTFRRNLRRLYNRKYDLSELHLVHTSGTTGTPLTFHWAPEEPSMEWAFVIHQWQRAGYSPYDFRVEIRGPQIFNNRKLEVTLDGSIRLDPIITSPQQAEYYLKIIRKLKPRFIHGYPSALASLAKIAQEHGLDAESIHLKAIFLTSEIAWDWERDIIEKVFQVRTFAHYGMTEHVATAAECEYSRDYHFVPQYGIVEIDHRTGEIVATGFLNFAVPFIRYRTTDVVVNVRDSKCKCSRNYFPRVAQIVGRLDDVLIRPDGNFISPAAVTHLIKGLKTVNALQILQESYDYVVVRVEPLPMTSVSQTEMIGVKDKLLKLFGNDVKLEIRIEPIKRGRTGKFKWVVSKPARRELSVIGGRWEGYEKGY